MPSPSKMRSWPVDFSTTSADVIILDAVHLVLLQCAHINRHPVLDDLPCGEIDRLLGVYQIFEASGKVCSRGGQWIIAGVSRGGLPRGAALAVRCGHGAVWREQTNEEHHLVTTSVDKYMAVACLEARKENYALLDAMLAAELAKSINQPANQSINQPINK